MPRRLGIPLVAGDCGDGCMPTTSVNLNGIERGANEHVLY